MVKINTKPLLSTNQKQRLYTADLLLRVSKELPANTNLGRVYAIKANKAWTKFLKTK
jgi:hypothetical protein